MGNSSKSVFGVLSGFMDKISNVSGLVAAGFNLALTLLVFIGVFARYLFGHPIEWRDEIVQYLFIWANIMALCYATYQESHASSDMLYEHLPSRVQFAITMTGYCLVLVCIAFVTYYGFQTLGTYYSGEWRSETEYEFLLWPIMAVIPIGFLLFGLECIVMMRKLVIRMKTTGSIRKQHSAIKMEE
ncbi:MAG: TRAP transporter small permease [Deltaproteobacteria bacterium]